MPALLTQPLYRITFFLTAGLISCSSIFCQVVIQPAILVSRQNDTLRGFVEYKEWNNNPKSIRFRKTRESAAETFTPLDLISFQVNQADTYIGAVVRKDIRPVDYATLKEQQSEDDVFMNDTVFLRRLAQADAVSLFALTDNKEHYFIQKPDEDFVELTYKVSYVENASGNYLNYQHFYKAQLSPFIVGMPNFDALNRQLEILQYTESSLTSFFKKLPGGSEILTTKTIPDLKRTVFFVGGGASIANLQVSGDAGIANMDFSGSTLPSFNIGVDMFSKRNLGDFMVRLEAQYTSMHCTGNATRVDYPNPTVYETYELKVNSITPALGLFYGFFRKPTSRIFTGLSLGYSFSSYPVNRFTKTSELGDGTRTFDNYYAFENSWININAKIGAIFLKHWEINASYLLIGSFSRFVYFDISPNLLNLSAAYRF